MRVFQHSVTQRNATQCKSFFATKKCCVLFMQPQTPQRRLRLLVALRKQIETTSIFPQRRRRTRPTNQICDHVQPMTATQRNGAVRCVKKYASRCGIAAVVRCVALLNAGKSAWAVESCSHRCVIMRNEVEAEGWCKRYAADEHQILVGRNSLKLLLSLIRHTVSRKSVPMYFVP